MECSTIIIGAGPAGLFLGWCLKKADVDFVIIEKGKDFHGRKQYIPWDVSFGFGGAGLFSDGKISYPPAASKLWKRLNVEDIKTIYGSICELFSLAGIFLKKWDDGWEIKSHKSREKVYESIHIEMKYREKLLDILFAELGENVVLQKKVSHIKTNAGKYVIMCSDGDEYVADNVVVATGKASCRELFDYGLNIKWRQIIEMGVRIEGYKRDFLPNCHKQMDYKYIDYIDENTEVRTFCSCMNGRIIESLYDDAHVTYNGETLDYNSEKANIGIVLRNGDCGSAYYKEMQSCYRKQDKYCFPVKRYLGGESILGDNCDKQIRNVIGKIIKDNFNGNVYGPEIERYGLYPKLADGLMSRKGLFFIGDASALFRGLLAAFVSAGYVARRIIAVQPSEVQAAIDTLKIKVSDIGNMKLVFTAQSKNIFYFRNSICQFVFKNNCLPINPFRLFDYFLSDKVDRNVIRKSNNQLIVMCDELWTFGTISDGVLFEIALAIFLGKKLRFFSIGSSYADIKEISSNDLTFEPEVHSRQIRKQDIVDFINQNNDVSKRRDEQLSLF